MIHGDCSSRGCYAMTDEEIGEIYSLARDAFLGGQKEVQIQAYPFRMTPANMARHRNNPNFAFWQMIKEGNDHFEVSHLEPKVDVCDRHYVFDAVPPGNSTRPLVFNPTGRCPKYQVDPTIASAVQAKQQKDNYEFAELVKENVPVAPLDTGTDGGMNRVFIAKLDNRPTPTTTTDTSTCRRNSPAGCRRRISPPAGLRIGHDCGDCRAAVRKPGGQLAMSLAACLPPSASAEPATVASTEGPDARAFELLWRPVLEQADGSPQPATAPNEPAPVQTANAERDGAEAESGHPRNPAAPPACGPNRQADAAQARAAARSAKPPSRSPTAEPEQQANASATAGRTMPA